MVINLKPCYRVPSDYLFSPLDDSLEAQSVFAHPPNTTTQILLKMLSGDRGIVYHFTPHNTSIKSKTKTKLSSPTPSSLYHPPGRFQTSSIHLLQPPSSFSYFDFPVAGNNFLYVMQFDCASAYVICICTHYHLAQQMKNHSLDPPSLESNKIL